MEYSVNLTLDRAYFSEAFDQSIRYASKWRKAERIIGTIFLAFGIVFLFVVKEQSVLPVVLILFGLYELFSPLIKKPLWVGRQLKAKAADSNVQIVLSDSGITTSGIYSKSEITWEGVERILQTPKGVFVWPQKGMHIYLPKAVAGEDVIGFLLEKKSSTG